MIIPIRCFTCGRPIAHLWEKYVELVEEGKSPKEALDELGIHRYCCRRMFLSHVDLLKESLPYTPPRLGLSR
ncbi:MAG: DNA-directed RNA polymerase subunit N [Euryarchaeota archaeon]